MYCIGLVVVWVVVWLVWFILFRLVDFGLLWLAVVCLFVVLRCG